MSIQIQNQLSGTYLLKKMQKVNSMFQQMFQAQIKETSFAIQLCLVLIMLTIIPICLTNITPQKTLMHL